MSTSSQGDSRVRTSATLDEGPGSTEHDRGSGESSIASFAYYDHATSSWRTRQGCLFADLDEFSGTWPRSGTMRSGIAYRRRPLVPLSSVTGSSLWPTPTASDQPSEGQVRLLRARVLAGDLSEDDAGAILGKSVWDGQGKLRPYFPTPRADSRDNCGGSNARAAAKKRGVYLGRKENPEFREWLMGFPVGWSEIPPSETP